jgi:hypothetical protein
MKSYKEFTLEFNILLMILSRLTPGGTQYRKSTSLDITVGVISELSQRGRFPAPQIASAAKVRYGHMV